MNHVHAIFILIMLFCGTFLFSQNNNLIEKFEGDWYGISYSEWTEPPKDLFTATSYSYMNMNMNMNMNIILNDILALRRFSISHAFYGSDDLKRYNDQKGSISLLDTSILDENFFVPDDEFLIYDRNLNVYFGINNITLGFSFIALIEPNPVTLEIFRARNASPNFILDISNDNGNYDIKEVMELSSLGKYIRSSIYHYSKSMEKSKPYDERSINYTKIKKFKSDEYFAKKFDIYRILVFMKKKNDTSLDFLLDPVVESSISFNQYVRELHGVWAFEKEEDATNNSNVKVLCFSDFMGNACFYFK